jgi:hypothetical protein
MSLDGFRCHHCGKWHEGLPMSWNFEAPLYWNPLDASIKTGDSELTSDLCVINREHFFIKGNLEMRVTDRDSVFSFSIWTSLSAANFERVDELWRDPVRVNEPPYFGWLSNNIPGYPETLNLKTHVHSRSVGIRPFVELEPTDHPLAVEQKSGITLARVAELAAFFIHASAK